MHVFNIIQKTKWEKSDIKKERKKENQADTDSDTKGHKERWSMTSTTYFPLSPERGENNHSQARYWWCNTPMCPFGKMWPAIKFLWKKLSIHWSFWQNLY